MIRREKTEVFHVKERKAIVMMVTYEGDPESSGDLATILGDAWHEYAVQHNIDPVRGMEMIHAFKNKH